MNNKKQFIGIVKGGRLYILTPGAETEEPTRLTTISMVEAMSPEAKEIDLGKFEGKAIAVSGHGGGGWIYSAEVLDQAGPVLTAVAARAFGREDLLNPN